MLTSTFCHIDGVGPTTERKLWGAGIRCWDDLPASDAGPLPAGRMRKLREEAAWSAERLSAGDVQYFYNALPTAEHWRLFAAYREQTAYLDIETTGLDHEADRITTIVVYDGTTIRHYVQGQNLDDFARDIEAYRMIVTYNGKSFDVPFIRSALRARMGHAHIDLRYVLSSLGFRGGLKECEKLFPGLARDDLADIDGYFAVLLWNDYRRNGNPLALETLLAYNTLDVVNLAVLMAEAYNRKVRQLPLPTVSTLPVPVRPEIPFRADHATIARIRGDNPWQGIGVRPAWRPPGRGISDLRRRMRG